MPTTEVPGFGLIVPLTQAGSFALLVYLAVWVLPAIVERIVRMREQEHTENLALVSKLTGDTNEALDRLSVTFRDEVRYEREQCQRQFEALLDEIKRLRSPEVR